MKTIRYTLLAMMLLLVAAPLMAQPRGEFTTEGREFWVIFQKNFRDWVPDEATGSLRRADPLQLELFITSSENARVTVDIAGLGISRAYSVPAGTVITVPIDTAAQVRSSEKVEDLGIHIVSDKPIAVYGLNRRYQTTDTYLALPVNVLGTSYRAICYKWLQNDLLSQLAVVSTEDGTEVTFTPSVATRGTDAGRGGSKGNPAKKPFTVTLDKGQVYQLISKFDALTSSDLTGTLIESNKPVAVFSGHNCAYVPDPKVKACNLLVEQLPPLRAWGRQFFVGALSSRSSSVLRVLASEDDTQVFENNRLVATLNTGEFYENSNQTQHTMVTSDKPVLVAQYSKGFDNGDDVGDPMMIIVAPTEQFLDGYRFATPVRGSWHHYINLIVPTSTIGDIRLDGQSIAANRFKPFGISTYSIAQQEVGYGTHVITNSAPFGLYSYGFGYDEAAYDAYGNGGGQSMEQVIQYPDTIAPAMDALYVRSRGSSPDVITAIARDDRLNDKGLAAVTLLDNENLDATIPAFEPGTPQVSIPLTPLSKRQNAYARFRLRDRADNVSIYTICAKYDERGDSLVVTVLKGDEGCDFSSDMFLGFFLKYSVLDNNVEIAAGSEPLKNTVVMKGNPGVPTYGFGGFFEQVYDRNLYLTGRVGLDFWTANVIGYDSTLSVASDNRRISEEYRLKRLSVLLTLGPGIHYYLSKRHLYAFGLLNISIPLYTSETLTRTILSPSDLVYDNGSGEFIQYDGSGPSGLPIVLTPEMGLGISFDFLGGWRIIGELGAGHTLTSISPDRSWGVSYLFARFGGKLRF